MISPVLSNLFLHYTFDVWMTNNHPESLWCRYADDGICHCKTKEQAESLLTCLELRFRECGLEIHPDKTKIVCCDRHNKTYSGNKSFVFLGYEFRARAAEQRSTGEVFTSFLPAISPKAKKGITEKIRQLGVRNRADLSLQEIAQMLNPMIQGWINYYGKFTKSALTAIFQRINATLVRWSMKKYKKLNGRITHAAKCMREFANANKHLFAHWKIGITSAFF